MYRLIVASIVRRVWRKVGAGDVEAPSRMMAPTMQFKFVGDTPVSAEFEGPERFREWFADVFERFPGLQFDLREVAVAGWPWRTRVAVRLDVSATLADGTAYRNEAAQWLTLRWGKVIEDWVVEDTAALARACEVQAARSAPA